MPDVSFPSITVRVSYAGVGPLEMEELVTRPLEQAMSAVAGLERLESTSSEGIQPRHPELRVGHRPERGRRRREKPPRSRPRTPAGGSRCAGHVQVRREHLPDHGRRCRRGLRPRPAARDRRARSCPRGSSECPGVASVTVEGGLRRQIHVELSKEKITALNLPVDRITSLLRSENQNIPARRNRRRRPHLPGPQPGTVRESRTRSAISSS